MFTKKKILLYVLSLTILFSATLLGSEKEIQHAEETLTQTHEVITLKKEVPSLLTEEISPYAKLPFWIILIPLVSAGFILLVGKNEKLQKVILFLSTLFILLLLLSLFKPVVQGIIVNEHQYKGTFYSLPFFPFFNLTFKVDPAGLLIALISGLIWFVGTLFSFSSFKQEKHFLRYQFFSLTTYAANLGVLFAGDLFTLYIFFEGMVFLPYALFAHRATKRALRGANIALYIGIISGLCLLAGIFLLYTFTGNLEIKPMAEKINTVMPGIFKYILAGLMIIGFGGKAGIFLEHLWLPAAYPESPEPTAALSSGAMIKAGAYGIFRTVNMLFVPENVALINEWLTLSNIGYIVIWIGVITMFFAVLSALISSNSKRMLAYHSISQMGFIVMGIGCAAYLGTEGAMGLAGALYHMVNHSLFKACLFLTVGAVYLKTDELDMYKLGGLWRNMPLVAIGMFIAVCGISGIPGFNGFASKCLLHHAIVEAYQHSLHFSKTYTPDFGLRIAEIIFIITCAGTFASNTKLFILTFLRKRPEKYNQVKSAPWSMQIPILILIAIIVFIGLFPNWLLEKIIGPALAYFNFNPSSHSY
ncbi:MAG TPA: proton-conducting membrane transporter, partial [Elusimicrobia bacterium]|nr:proton-conducting membrane transporter [Elusimicrobiota bacterium]